MFIEDIRTLPVGTRVRGSLGEGVIKISKKKGKGVRFDDFKCYQDTGFDNIGHKKYLPSFLSLFED